MANDLINHLLHKEASIKNFKKKTPRIWIASKLMNTRRCWAGGMLTNSMEAPSLTSHALSNISLYLAVNVQIFKYPLL